MNYPRLLEHLNEILAIELFMGEAYPQYAQQAQNPEDKARLEAFGLESDKHRGIATQLLEDLGGKPNRARELRSAVAAWTKGLVDIGRKGDYGALRNLQDLLITEYRDRSNWQILEVVATTTGDDRLRRAIDQVRPDEHKHVSWLETRVYELASAALAEPAP